MEQIKGKCKYCGREYAKSGITRHLNSCKERKAALESGKITCGYYDIVITDRYDKIYWMVAQAKETATFAALDRMLRDIWVECCGHLSSFEVEGLIMESETMADPWGWGPETEPMDYALGQILTVGTKFRYTYDFGSSTELELKVASYREAGDDLADIEVIARNNAPEYICSRCRKNKAAWFNPEGVYDDEPFICEECAEDEDEYLLPICNSPREGVCCYEGSPYDDRWETYELDEVFEPAERKDAWAYASEYISEEPVASDEFDEFVYIDVYEEKDGTYEVVVSYDDFDAEIAGTKEEMMKLREEIKGIVEKEYKKNGAVPSKEFIDMFCDKYNLLEEKRLYEMIEG